MPENNKLVPQSKVTPIEISPATIPEEIRLQQLRQAVQATDIPFREKRRLVKQEVEAMLEHRKLQIAAMLRTEEKRLDAQEEIAEAAIILQKDRMIFEIRDAFSKTLTTLGLRVNQEHLNIMTDYGEQLTKFKRELQKKDLDENMREYLMQAADNAFDAVKGQLGRLAGEIFKKSQEDID